MKHVYLLRHAKSSWKDASLADADRPLAGRGRRAASAIARHMQGEGIDPKLVLCSPARRARETLERIEPVLGRHGVKIEPELYEAGADGLLACLRGVPDRAGSVMLIGHNPSIQQLALGLARPSAERHELAAKYPTAALVTLRFTASSWRELEPGSGDVVGFVRPRELTA